MTDREEESDAIYKDLPDTKTLIRETRRMADAAGKTAAAAMERANQRMREVDAARELLIKMRSEVEMRNEANRPW